MVIQKVVEVRYTQVLSNPLQGIRNAVEMEGGSEVRSDGTCPMGRKI